MQNLCWYLVAEVRAKFLPGSILHPYKVKLSKLVANSSERDWVGWNLLGEIYMAIGHANFAEIGVPRTRVTEYEDSWGLMSGRHPVSYGLVYGLMA